MLRLFTKKLAGALVALLVVTGTLLAQPAGVTDPSEPVSDLRVRAEEIHKDAVKDTQRVQTLQLKARKDKDVVRLTCINDKLLQIKALRNMLDIGLATFAASEKQVDFDSVTGNGLGIRSLREQAQLCAGEAQFISDIRTGYQGPDIPDDPSKDLFPDGVEPPAYSSPYN